MDSAQSLMDTEMNTSPLSDVEEEFEEQIMEEEVSLLSNLKKKLCLCFD